MKQKKIHYFTFHYKPLRSFIDIEGAAHLYRLQTPFTLSI